MLMEVDRWTGFTRHFAHLKTNEPVKDPALLLTAILRDATHVLDGLLYHESELRIEEHYP
jgi:Tn3 transposase DDE domain